MFRFSQVFFLLSLFSLTDDHNAHILRKQYKTGHAQASPFVRLCLCAPALTSNPRVCALNTERARHRFCLKTSSAQHSGTHGANSLEFFPAGGVLGSARGRVREGDEEVRDTDGMQSVAAYERILSAAAQPPTLRSILQVASMNPTESSYFFFCLFFLQQCCLVGVLHTAGCDLSKNWIFLGAHSLNNKLHRACYDPV